MMENSMCEHKSLDFTAGEEDAFSLSDDEGTIDEVDSEMLAESSQAVGNGRVRSFSSRSEHNHHHHHNEWPISPVSEEAARVERKPQARIITPDRQPSFFVCPQMMNLQLQIEQTALRFYKCMRRSDDTRSFVRRPVGSEETVLKSIHSFERSQEYKEVRLQVYHLLQSTQTRCTPFLDSDTTVDGRLADSAHYPL